MNKEDEHIEIIQEFQEKIIGWKHHEQIMSSIYYIINKNDEMIDLLIEINERQKKGELLIHSGLTNLIRNRFPNELKQWADYTRIKNKMSQK
jgi:hypothetical protein